MDEKILTSSTISGTKTLIRRRKPRNKVRSASSALTVGDNLTFRK
jgi:hypothetical protein